MDHSFVFVFDLDDTLYKEIEFLKSAYKSIAKSLDSIQTDLLYENMLKDYYNGINVFENLNRMYSDYSVNDFLNIYRNHEPEIYLDVDTISALLFLQKHGVLGIITDGRTITQRNKIKALGLNSLFKDILISEEAGYSKPDLRLFEYFHKYNSDKYFYIANDTSKDFITPNHLGWKSVCLLDKENVNIKKQDFSLEDKYLPQIKITSLSELIDIVSQLSSNPI